MNRKEIYAQIKKYNLQDEIKKICGDNYTRVSSFALNDIITKYLSYQKKECVQKQEVIKIPTQEAFNKLVEVLKKKHILLDSEVNYINS